MCGGADLYWNGGMLNAKGPTVRIWRESTNSWTNAGYVFEGLLYNIAEILQKRIQNPHIQFTKPCIVESCENFCLRCH